MADDRIDTRETQEIPTFIENGRLPTNKAEKEAVLALDSEQYREYLRKLNWLIVPIETIQASGIKQSS